MIIKDLLAGRGGELEFSLVIPGVVQVETHCYGGSWLRPSGLSGVAEVLKAGRLSGRGAGWIEELVIGR